ncbi:MAG: pentapeptide repeat-containing protein [Cyanobacteria bacterium REEB444]|nr:pentapeptide repeat-containing protein [Cyanobacteria bacterium REEB444]
MVFTGWCFVVILVFLFLSDSWGYRVTPLNQHRHSLVSPIWVISIIFGGLTILTSYPHHALAAANQVIYPQRLSNSQLQDRDFSNQDLRASEFANSKLLRTDFHGSNLRGAVFSRSVLVDTNLSDANLTDAMFDQVGFQTVDLTNAILSNTILFRSQFTNVNITGADFSDALLDGAQARDLCQVATGTNSKTGISTRDSLGCS